MKNQEAEKRAAFVLGGELKKWNVGEKRWAFGVDVLPVNLKPTNQLYGPVNLKAEELNFTTSYDWAYLLMKACHDKGLIRDAHEQIGKNAELEYCFTDASESPDQPDIATPEQITLACLEVLEGVA